MITKEITENVVVYPPQILKLTTTIGFIGEFYLQCQTHPTAKEAFEHLNDLHEQFFGQPKFSDYHTFKNVRNRINKKFLDKNKN